MNKIIRATAVSKGVYLWQVARKMEVSEPTLYRKLRLELPDDEKESILQIINQLSEEARHNA